MIPASPTSRTHGWAARTAFTMIEIVMVMAIIGVVAALAVPRMSTASESARNAQLTANERALQDAVDVYTAEHGNRSPAINADGSVTTNANLFLRRLVETTDEFGNPDPMGIYGPYLRSRARNPYANDFRIRLDGAAAGAGLSGWRFDTVASEIEPDDTGYATRIVRIGSTTIKKRAAANQAPVDAGASLEGQPVNEDLVK